MLDETLKLVILTMYTHYSLYCRNCRFAQNLFKPESIVKSMKDGENFKICGEIGSKLELNAIQNYQDFAKNYSSLSAKTSPRVAIVI